MAKPFYNYAAVGRKGLLYFITMLIVVIGIAISVYFGLTLPIQGFLGFQYALLPAILAAVLAIWLMPEKDVCYEWFMQPLMIIYFIFVICWPAYLSIIPLPGGIWTPPGRILLFLLTFFALINFSVSKQAKARIAKIYTAYPLAVNTMLILLVFQFTSMFFSSNFGYSSAFFFKYAMSTALAFIIAITVIRSERAILSIPYISTAIVFYLFGLVLIELSVERNIWAEFMPSWMIRGGGVAMDRILSSIYRNGIYRTKGPSITPLEFGELFAYLIPFAFYFIFERKNIFMKAISLVCLVVAFYAALTTGSRLAHVGYLFATVTYIFLWGIRGWIQDARNILGPAIVILYSTFVTLLMFALFASTRLNNMVFGGAGTEASTQGRIIQWQNGFPRIIENPVFGHGIGRGAEILGSVTIDSYWLSIILETGLFALICFLVFFCITIVTAAKIYLFSSKKNKITSMGAALASSLGAFLLVKAVLSQASNHSMIYMFCALVFIIAINQKQAIQR
jgi:O-antigen ligase